MPRIAIVGAGIAGLTLANALRRMGVRDFVVFDTISKFSDVGVGISLNQAAFRALEKIDPNLEERVRRRGATTHNFMYSSNKGKELFGFIPPLTEEHKERMRKYGPVLGTVIRRCDIMKELLRAIPEENLQLGTGVVGIEQAATGAVIETTRPGTQKFVECQTVVGADGVFSGVRMVAAKETNKKSHFLPTYSGMSALGIGFRFLPGQLTATGEDNGVPQTHHEHWYLGPGLSGTGFLTSCVQTFRGDSLLLPPEERQEFSTDGMTWEADVLCVGRFGGIKQAERCWGLERSPQGLFFQDSRFPCMLSVAEQCKFPKHITDLLLRWADTPEELRLPLYHWHMHTLPAMGCFWGINNIVLIGDAAHPVAPWVNHSVGLGIEDAFHLACNMQSSTLMGARDLSETMKYRDDRIRQMYRDAKRRQKAYFPRSIPQWMVRQIAVRSAKSTKTEDMWTHLDNIVGYDYPQAPLFAVS